MLSSKDKFRKSLVDVLRFQLCPPNSCCLNSQYLRMRPYLEAGFERGDQVTVRAFAWAWSYTAAALTRGKSGDVCPERKPRTARRALRQTLLAASVGTDSADTPIGLWPLHCKRLAFELPGDREPLFKEVLWEFGPTAGSPGDRGLSRSMERQELSRLRTRTGSITEGSAGPAPLGPSPRSRGPFPQHPYFSNVRLHMGKRR